jgi:hypothetical protein
MKNRLYKFLTGYKRAKRLQSLKEWRKHPHSLLLLIRYYEKRDMNKKRSLKEAELNNDILLGSRPAYQGAMQWHKWSKTGIDETYP